jgi:hypothetical protein
MLRTLTFFALSGAAFGQLTGPVLGYLPDGSSLRAINGIPAAGAVGAALGTGRNLALVQPAPAGQALALATAEDGQALLLTPNPDGNVQVVSIAGAASGASQIVFSPNGTAAGLWFSSNGHLQILTNLASTAVVRDIDASFLGGDPGTLAVSDDGQWAAGSWSGKVYAVGPAGQANGLPFLGSAESLAFLHGKNDVVIISASQVMTIADIAGAMVPTVLWSLPAGVTPSPDAPVAVGIAASADNSLIAVAANNGELYTINVATLAGTPANCDCKPLGLSGLGGSVFRLTGINAGPLKLFDAATNDVWFVPLAAPVVAGGQQ